VNRRLVGSVLQMLDDTPTSEQIESYAATTLEAWKKFHPDDETTVEALVREIETLCMVWVPTGQILDDFRGHKEWLGGRKADLEWKFWERYEAFLEGRLNWPRSVVRRLDDVTDDILGRLEDPERPGAWDRRGLVVGRVQSGKTSTYIGLIAKAADAGYKLVIVLAGLHNSLRSQTQVRMDEGFLGFDTQRRLRKDSQTIRMGVGELAGYGLLNVHPLTSSADNGDFSLQVARTQNVMVGGADPVLLVVKKNKSILANVTKWATTLRQVEDPATGRKVVRDVPLLIIDDEADNASVDTSKVREDVPRDENGAPDEDVRPSTINGQIRALLAAFEKKAYVGYTATPFANILSQFNEDSPSIGEGLFPRSFIINLRPPSNYLGPTSVFGLERALGEEPARDALPLLREVEDAEAWLPTKHKKDQAVGPLPDSLNEAIRAFLLASAARAARGQRSAHNSMLVHVTRFTAVQRQLVDAIGDEVDRLRRRLRFGDGDGLSVWDEFERLWREDFERTSVEMGPVDPLLGWDAVRAHLVDAITAVKVKEVNGTAKDVLDYVENAENGLTVIAVGGDKLSRGLTLEGLTVTYFLRASRMYDTLMQMGRWFGYRPGYSDLCRLYSTPELIRWYAHITLANEELMDLFDEMVASHQTPETFGLRVRKSPDGLMVTSPAKMRHSKTVRLTFGDSTAETITFRRDDIERNIAATDRLIAELGFGWTPSARTSGKARPTRLWRKVKPEIVEHFLEDFRTDPDVLKSDSKAIAKFIRASAASGDLSEWTVALVSVDDDEGKRASIGGLEVGLVTRKLLAPNGTLTIKRIVSPSDETLDLTEGERARALAATIDRWREAGVATKQPTVPVGWAVRQQRTRERGLLLLYPLSIYDASTSVGPVVGFAVSFPSRGVEREIEYVVNQVHLADEFGWEEEA
jgi:hypothetical protein